MKEEFHSQCKNPVEILENVFVFTVFLVLVVTVFKIFLPVLKLGPFKAIDFFNLH